MKLDINYLKFILTFFYTYDIINYNNKKITKKITKR